MQKTNETFVVIETQSNEKYGIAPKEKELDSFCEVQQAIGYVYEKAQNYINDVIGARRYQWNIDELGSIPFEAVNRETGHHIKFSIEQA